MGKKMAESSVRTPLLSDTDDICGDSCQISRKNIDDESITGLSSGNLSVTCKLSPSRNEGDQFSCLELEGEDHDASPPDVICVFVVAFDTRAGNIIEYCVPDDVDLEGVEFKAMASGSHNISYDFIYFKKGRLYGLSCFENMPVDSQIERGARMKSVGILASTYHHLHHYKPFLEKQVSISLQSPGIYENLHKFYEKKKGVLQMSSEFSELMTSPRSPFVSLKIIHPAGCFSQFVQFFGQQIFLLWKFTLLKKRILFFSPPPIGIVCYQVYCTNCLSNHHISEILHTGANVLFYVNVADVDMLETADNYIACTTEKILEGKPHLYDVYIDNQNVCVDTVALKRIVVTATDRSNLNKLVSQQRESLSESDFDGANDEFTFIKFFTNMNNKLFRTLLDASYSQEKTLTSDHIRTMGLDPFGDRQFLKDLIEMYRIDVQIVADSPCCP